MKIKILLCSILVLLLALPLAALPPIKGSTGTSFSATIDNTTAIDVNRIYMFVTNHGNFGRDLSGVFGYDYGTWYPYTGNPDDIANNVNLAGDKSPNYASGIWVGGKVGNDTRVAISEYASEYVPGPMLAQTFQPDNADFRVYKLFKDSLKANPNQDYLDYMNIAAVSQGAPTVIDEFGDEIPDMLGDQMLWTVYNEADPDHHDEMLTDPLGIEVKQTVFAFDREGSLGNMVFVRYRVYNNGPNTIDSLFISLWCDPDLGDATNDLVGSDTLLSLGYVYNATANDVQYGNDAPPAMGFDFFQGPLVHTGDLADTALMWGYGWPGYTNLGMVSFNKYINGTDPDDFTQVYEYMQGLDASEGGIPYVYDGDTLLYVHSGDPITGVGDIDIAPADRRWMQTTGPITFAPGDSTEILAAIIIGQGSSNLQSIATVKGLDDFAQTLYEGELDTDSVVFGSLLVHNSFLPPLPPAKPNVTVSRLSGELAFTWDDTSEVDPGDFEFEGYTVWQGSSASGPWVELATYDVVNAKTDALIDTIVDAYSNTKQPVVRRAIINNGLRYKYATKLDAIGGGDLDDVTPYFFRITAFSWPVVNTANTSFTDNEGGPIPIGDRFLESATNLTVIPQPPLPGIHLNADYDTEIPVEHPAGLSQGVITVKVVDPNVVTGDDYEITFGLDTSVAYTEDTTVYITETILPDTCDVYFDTTVVIDTTVVPNDTSIIGWVAVNCIDTTIDSTTIEGHTDTVETVFWNLENTSTNTMLLEEQFNQTNDDAYFTVEGLQVKVAGPAPGFLSFQVVANANGVLDPPEAGAFAFRDFPTPDGSAGDGNPSDNQQVGDGHWAFHTGDNGGSSGGGNRGPYQAFLDRTFRGDPARIAQLGAYDWEMRFTGSNSNPGVNGGYALSAFTNGVGFWVPFELWRTGIGTPDDPSDDLRLIPWIFDDGGDSLYYLSAYGSDADGNCGPGGCEHSASGADNDPYTDWVYWRVPVDATGAAYTSGTAGYDEFVDSIMADPTMANWPYNELAVMGRTVLVNWNGGDQPPFNQDLPEQGTVFRLLTAKPNATNDVFTFTTSGYEPTFTSTEADLDKIKTVPNPFYLNGPYDPSPGQYAIQFFNLPDVCTIDIYNLIGEHIITIDKDDPSTSVASWDVLTKQGLPVASGIYVYVVDAPGFGKKVGKMAVFVEQEVLRIY